MQARAQRTWLAALAPLLLCLPCLLAPLLLLGGAAVLAVVGSFVTENLWLVGAILLLSVVPVAVLIAQRRSRARWAGACYLPASESPHTPRNTNMEVHQ